jgi:hypothetical protein
MRMALVGSGDRPQVPESANDHLDDGQVAIAFPDSLALSGCVVEGVNCRSYPPAVLLAHGYGSRLTRFYHWGQQEEDRGAAE